MSDKSKNQVQDIKETIEDEKKSQVQRKAPPPFRGIIIPITEDNKFGIQLSGGTKLLEAYGVLSLIMEQLHKDLSIIN